MPHDWNIMSRTLSKLVDLDIDEVSVVDRGANQHSLIAFSKSLQSGGVDVSEEPMADDDLVFDESGQEVFVEELEHGDTVFDAEGNEYVFVEDGEEEIGKAGAFSAFKTGMRGAEGPWAAGLNSSANQAGRSGRQAGRRVKDRYTNLRTSTEGGRSVMRGSENFRRNRVQDAALGVGGLGLAGAGAYGASKWSGGKSLGDSVIEELSKAVTDADRDEVIAKAMDEVEIYKAQAAEALAWAEQEHDVRVTDAFISKAAEYNLPVSPEVLGPILKSIAEVLDEEELDVLDALLSAVGDALYDEIGYVGESSNSSVMDQVDSMAGEYVGKSDFSHAQMTTAMFEANPAAYDAYLSEMGR